MRVFIPGKPEPQGSTKAYVVAGRARITSANDDLKPWRAQVAAFTREAVGPKILYPRPTAVLVSCVFVMPRRASEPKRHTPEHTRKPDLDKLIRAILDAITGIVMEDDSQVVQVTATKQTAALDEQPGLDLIFRQVDRG